MLQLRAWRRKPQIRKKLDSLLTAPRHKFNNNPDFVHHGWLRTSSDGQNGRMMNTSICNVPIENTPTSHIE